MDVMRKVTIRLTEEEYEQVMQQYRLTPCRSLQAFLVQKVVGKFSDSSAVKDNSGVDPAVLGAFMEMIERRVREGESRLTALEEKEDTLKWRMDTLVGAGPPPFEVGTVAASAVLPDGKTYRPDPLDGIREHIPPLTDPAPNPFKSLNPTVGPLRPERRPLRLSKTQARKIAPCVRCRDGCVPEICVCGCHRKERGY